MHQANRRTGKTALLAFTSLPGPRHNRPLRKEISLLFLKGVMLPFVVYLRAFKLTCLIYH